MRAGLLFVLAFAALLLPLTASAATVDVWPEGRMPGRGASEPEGDRPPRGDNVRRITNVSRPTLTVFPAQKKGAPAIVVCPGGGYSYVVYDKEGTEVAAWLNSAGVTALVLKYRVPNNREGALQDIQRALSLARARASEWNIDPKRLGVMGFSAGGNLAAKASTRFDQRAYTAIDEVDRQSCRPDFAVLVYPAYLEKDGKVAPDLDLKAKIPPTLIVSTEDDKTFVQGSKLYKAALDEAKAPNEFLLYPTGGHGYGLRSEKDVRVWPQAALDWLHKIGVLKARRAAVTPPARDGFHVYLLMGQSNMGLPIVVGQLGEFLTPEKYPYAEQVRGAIVRIPAVVPGAAYADSEGLGQKGDGLHFSADAEKELGARFAKAVRELQARRGPKRRL